VLKTFGKFAISHVLAQVSISASVQRLRLGRLAEGLLDPVAEIVVLADQFGRPGQMIAHQGMFRQPSAADSR
jgi:hypothetical protein